MSLSYEVDFCRYYDHLASVRLTFDAPTDCPSLWLPTWIAGSYLIREFAKHIAQVRYQSTNGTQTHLAQKVSKNRFILPYIKQGERVSVSYEVYCHDLSVRTAFVDGTRLFGNFSSLLMMVSSLENMPCKLSLSVPHTFLRDNPSTTLALGLPYQTQLTNTGILYHFDVPRAFDSYDYPFEIGEQTHFEFQVHTKNRPITHRFFIAGKHHTHTNRLQADLTRICQSYIDWLEDTPFENYTFMTMATGNEYGGLEHLNSTALITPRTDLPSILESDEPSADYQRFLGLCSHEYFHAWWVKSVKPDVMMDNDLTAESYTPLLWVFEGFTSYIDDLMLLRSGVINKQSYLTLLTSQINRYAQTDGKYHQSVAESSFDTWIKLYRPDENTQNQSVSYYNKGALVALCLDLMLMRSNHRLFDVIKHFYDKSRQSPNKQYALTSDELGQVLGKMMGDKVWQTFYEDHVIGTKELPVSRLLSQAGIEINITNNKEKIWGASFKDDPMGLKISHINRDSSASHAGLSFGDVIVAINGIKVTKEELQRHTTLAKHARQAVIVHAFRRDELMCFYVKDHQPTIHNEYTLKDDGSAWLDF